MLPIWHFSHWSRAIKYRFVSPTRLCPSGWSVNHLCMLLPCHSVQWGTGDGFISFNLFPFVSEHILLKVLLQFGNARNGLRLNTRDYSTSWPGLPHIVGQLLHRTKGQVGVPSQPVLLLPSRLTWVLPQDLHPGAVLVQEGSCISSPNGAIDKSRALLKATIKVINLTSFQVYVYGWISLRHADHFI